VAAPSRWRQIERGGVDTDQMALFGAGTDSAVLRRMWTKPPPTLLGGTAGRSSTPDWPVRPAQKGVVLNVRGSSQSGIKSARARTG
jgi:hypothetical protein